MSAPDYPLLALGSYETYQLAHIAAYIAERIARHHRAPRGRHGRAARVEATRDIVGAATALGNATGMPVAAGDLPRPLDRDTFTAARGLLTTGPRSADVVSLAGAGLDGFAVVGHVLGVGAVGAQVASKDVADAVRAHLLTQPAEELTAWAVTDRPQRVPTLPRQVDLAAFVEHLDPTRPDDRAVVRNLRGGSRRTDAAIRGRFAHVDLDAPAIPNPPTTTAPSRRGPLLTPPARRAPAPGAVRAPGQRATTPTVPHSSAGPQGHSRAGADQHKGLQRPGR